MQGTTRSFNKLHLQPFRSKKDIYQLRKAAQKCGIDQHQSLLKIHQQLFEYGQTSISSEGLPQKIILSRYCFQNLGTQRNTDDKELQQIETLGFNYLDTDMVNQEFPFIQTNSQVALIIFDDSCHEQARKFFKQYQVLQPSKKIVQLLKDSQENLIQDQNRALMLSSLIGYVVFKDKFETIKNQIESIVGSSAKIVEITCNLETLLLVNEALKYKKIIERFFDAIPEISPIQGCHFTKFKFSKQNMNAAVFASWLFMLKSKLR